MILNKDNIKYCLLTWDHFENSHIESYAKEDMCISGLYNWSKVFDGDKAFPRTSEDFDKYNVIHLNLTAKNLPLIAKIYKKINRSITKILINVDYSFDLWNNNFPHQHLFLQELDKADYVYAVEPLMASILSDALKRNVACIPHPSEINKIKTFINHNRKLKIISSIHRYDMNYLFPWFCTKDLDNKWITSCVGANQHVDKVLAYYDECQSHLDFKNLIQYLSTHYLALESYTIHSYGRFSVECAALGIPCIGSKFVYSILKCFPDLIIENNNVVQAKKLIKLLIEDKEFYSMVCKKAIIKSEYFSFNNCEKLMLEFINS